MSSSPQADDEASIIAKLRGLQAQLSAHANASAGLHTQLNESLGVEAELAGLREGGLVFKRCGRVLVKQDVGEAKRTVESRLAYIRNDVCVVVWWWGATLPVVQAQNPSHTHPLPPPTLQEKDGSADCGLRGAKRSVEAEVGGHSGGGGGSGDPCYTQQVREEGRGGDERLKS